MLVVKSKIKEVAKDMNVAGTFAEALSDLAATLIRDAEARTEANKRSTVMGKDLALCFITNKKMPKEMLVVRSKVKETIKKPKWKGASRHGQETAMSLVDDKHIIRVVINRAGGIITVITFYPARKGRYY